MSQRARRKLPTRDQMAFSGWASMIYPPGHQEASSRGIELRKSWCHFLNSNVCLRRTVGGWQQPMWVKKPLLAILDIGAVEDCTRQTIQRDRSGAVAMLKRAITRARHEDGYLAQLEVMWRLGGDAALLRLIFLSESVQEITSEPKVRASAT